MHIYNCNYQLDDQLSLFEIYVKLYNGSLTKKTPCVYTVMIVIIIIDREEAALVRFSVVAPARPLSWRATRA
jgi:hypothetical protein